MWVKHGDKVYFFLFILQITLVYKLIQFYFLNGHVFKMVLDDKIPFVALFVMPYLLYVFVLIVIFVLALKNKNHFGAVAKSYFFAASICSLVFIIFPTMVIRPEILPSTVFNKLVLFIYSIDTAINSFPSEHVTFSVLANLCLIEVNRRLAFIIAPLTLLIVSSTLLIKQHYLIDVFAGLALAWLIYNFVFKKYLLATSSVIVESTENK